MIFLVFYRAFIKSISHSNLIYAAAILMRHGRLRLHRTVLRLRQRPSTGLMDIRTRFRFRMRMRINLDRAPPRVTILMHILHIHVGLW